MVLETEWRLSDLLNDGEKVEEWRVMVYRSDRNEKVVWSRSTTADMNARDMEQARKEGWPDVSSEHRIITTWPDDHPFAGVHSAPWMEEQP
jgi:hypothetical protein